MKANRSIIGIGFVMAVLLLVAACTGQAEPTPTATATPKPPVFPTATATTVAIAAGSDQQLGALTGLYTFGALELHDMEESLEALTDASEISPGTAGAIKNALAAVGGIPWPQDLVTETSTLRDALEELQAALTSADLEKARHVMEEAHEAWEDLSAATYDWLGEQ